MKLPLPHFGLFLAVFVVLLTHAKTDAQAIGGRFIYESLNLSPSARVSSLGGHHIAVADDDINLAARNPALLNPAMHEAISFSYGFHPAEIGYGYVAFGLHQANWETTLQGSIQFTNYGDLTRREIDGQEVGTFSAGDYIFTIGAARVFEERITIGANLKLLNSNLENYSSFGIAGDIAALYQDTASRFNLTFLVRNIGTQLSSYTEAELDEPLPFEIQVGLSKRLKYLPFRFSIIYRYLDRWNILYDDPNLQDESIFLGEEAAERSGSSIWFDNFFRHFVFNGELLLGKRENFRLRVGYNHLIRKELSVNDLRSLAGFTFGAGIKVSRFRIDYGRSTFHLGGGVNHFTVSTNFEEFR